MLQISFMKNCLMLLLGLSLSLCSISQTCDEREPKLISAIGSFSAATLYNTYGLIGSISDSYAEEIYDAPKVNSLLEAQVKMIDNLIKVLESLEISKSLTISSDREYSLKAIEVFKGLRKQEMAMQDYSSNKTERKLRAYEQQRDENWKSLSKLMGIDE